MKFLSYNILTGGKTRLPKILSVIKSQKPDFVAIQEACDFELDDGKLLREVSKALQLPHFELSPSSKYNFHVASFSKYPFTKIQKIPLFQNAALITNIKTDFGELTICNAHLCPRGESLRMQEIDLLMQKIDISKSTILMGDMNSVSATEGHQTAISSTRNTDGSVEFNSEDGIPTSVINKIKNIGMIDVGLELGQNHEITAPTGFDLHEPYALAYNLTQVRLDYVFVSPDLIKKVKKYKVVKNNTSISASDHFPILVELNIN